MKNPSNHEEFQKLIEDYNKDLDFIQQQKRKWLPPEEYLKHMKSFNKKEYTKKEEKK